MNDNIVPYLKDSIQHIEETKKALRKFNVLNEPLINPQKGNIRIKNTLDTNIYNGIFEVSESLAKSYAQIKMDIHDHERLSWIGPAHEIREVLRGLLDLLAPDSKVKLQSWYRNEPNTTGPTHKQRARYILEQHNAGSKEHEVVSHVVSLDDQISSIVRSTYTRASDAAHRAKNKREVLRILKYFEAVVHDLLDLD